MGGKLRWNGSFQKGHPLYWRIIFFCKSTILRVWRGLPPIVSQTWCIYYLLLNKIQCSTEQSVEYLFCYQGSFLLWYLLVKKYLCIMLASMTLLIRVLKRGGRFLCLELSHVEAPIFKELWVSDEQLRTQFVYDKICLWLFIKPLLVLLISTISIKPLSKREKRKVLCCHHYCVAIS